MKTINNSKIFYKYALWLLTLVVFSSNSLSQKKPVNFNRLTSSNGLSQNKAFNIVQDHDGFIWIGTEDGLNKYDGYNFEIFKRVPGDSLSLSDNWDNVLYVSKDGTLWIGGLLAGLNRFNSSTKTFTNYNNDHSNPNSIAGVNIRSISEDEKGNLWVATVNNGFDYMMVKEGKFIHMFNMLPQDYPLSKNQILFVHQDKNDYLWIGSVGKIHYFKIDYSEKDVPQLLPEKIENQIIKTAALSIKEDSKGNIWIGTAEEGLYRFDYQNKVLRKFEPLEHPELLNSLAILALEADESGNIWVGGVPNKATISQSRQSFPGLFKVNINSRTVQKYQHDPKDEKSMSGNYIYSLLIDRTGVLWAGTDVSGVNVYDKSVIKFSLLKTGSEDSRIQSALRGFYLDQNNVLWIASTGSGLIAYDRDKDNYEFFTYDKNNTNSISSDLVQSIYDDGKYLWVGTLQGLNRFDKNSKKFKRYYVDPSNPEFDANKITYKIIEIDKFPGYLWFGTNGGGLIQFDKEKEQFKQYKYDPENSNSLSDKTNSVRTLLYSKTRPDELWMGTLNGINILNLNSGAFRYYNYDPKDSSSLSHPTVMDFYEDPKGFIWIATYGGGLNRFDPKTGKFKRFTEENSGLPNNGVYGTLPDENGNLWISTNNGITKLNPDTFQFRNYTVDDGLQSEEFNGGSYYKATSGEMFFGGLKGFNSFFPSEVVDNKFIPNIVFTDLKIFNESVRVGGDSPLKQQISKTEEIVLPYWQNDISFEYVALHYSNPPKNRYAFKLENYENDWRYVDNVRIATYTNLDPGEYVFKVKGSNNDGLWNDQGKSIRLIIKPPWWKTNWAYGSYMLFFLVGIFSFDRYQRVRIKNVEQRKAQLSLLQAENERKTKELEEARQLQLSMLPKTLPQLPHLDIAVYMKTATEVGGDYYDFHVHLDGTLTVILGDATGHGMMSGMMVSIMKSLFMSDRTNKALKPFFENASAAIKDMQLGRLMMALTCVQISNNKVVTTNAGMPPLLIYRKKSRTVEEVAINNMPLGAMKEILYDVKELEIEKGDTMLMMSDGFAELNNGDNGIYGYKRARSSFEKSAMKEPEEIVTYLSEEGKRWTNDQELEDDITFVVIKVK
jgi:serine phosphatase RsbU (regulator of sigma subunit)/ligand-binding sensor domain-containing protein